MPVLLLILLYASIIIPDVDVVFDGEGELSLEEEIRLLLRRLDLTFRVRQRCGHVGVPKPSVHLRKQDKSVTTVAAVSRNRWREHSSRSVYQYQSIDQSMSPS